jgi:hypothetical protein
MSPMALVVAATVTACAAPPPSPLPAPRSTDTTYARLWTAGRPYREWYAAVDDRVELWRRITGIVQVPDALAQRARRTGALKLLMMVDDDCSDSANVLPYIARLVDLAPNLELRLVDMETGRVIGERHRTPDGRVATPTLVVLDARFDDRGCWVERPARLQHWYITRGDTVDVPAYRREKQGFYDFDHGMSTMEELVGVLEAAAAGTPRCGIPPQP